MRKETHNKISTNTRPAPKHEDALPKFFPLEERVQMLLEQTQAVVRRLNAMRDRLNGTGQCGEKNDEQAYPPIGVAAEDALQNIRAAHDIISTIDEQLFSQSPSIVRGVN